VIMAERDASITLAMTRLEKALENEAASSLAAAQANSMLVSTIHAFWGLVVQVRPALVTLGLKPPPIPSEPEGSISLWFTEVTRHISSLRRGWGRCCGWKESTLSTWLATSSSRACTASPPATRSHGSLAAAGLPLCARGLSPRAFFSVLLLLHFCFNRTYAVVHM
jgi:hypothetical protein